MSVKILEIFSGLQDPRRKAGNYTYPLNELIFLTISGVLCGCEDWQNISEFGKSQLSWLRKYLPYENGVASHDTLGRVFGLLDTSEFESCFTSWAEQLNVLDQGGIISIDGKRVCNSADAGSGKAAIHLVSAFAVDAGICIGQVATAEKSNEITAVPDLLDMLVLKNCIVTIDAMGCQRRIVEKIISKEADYVIALKSNQQELYEEAKQVFKFMEPQDIDNQIDAGHGRVETRVCKVVTDLRFVDEAEHWQAIGCVAMVQAQRINKKTGLAAQETRYYICSIKNARQINTAVRKHWGIENSLHWILDVRFNEDNEMKRQGESPYNFSFMTKTVANIIKLNKSKGSVKTKRLKAAWDSNFREELLNI